MKVLRFLWRRLVKGCDGDPEIAQGLRRLKVATDLHMIETAVARGAYLDNIDRQNASTRSLQALVDTMTKDRP